MKNSPIVPYLLIMAMGIAIIFFLSLDGAGKKQEAAKGDEGGAETTEVDGEALAKQTCIGCHGGDLTGQGTNPKIAGLDAEHIQDVVKNGQGAMPPGLLQDPAEIEAVAEYVSSLK